MTTTGRRAIVAVACVGALLASACQIRVTDPVPMGPSLPLTTEGASIVDSNGRQIVLRGVNWFGFETETHAPHGLWTRDHRDVLRQIRAAGFDTIRLPFSVASLRSSTTSGIDHSIGANAELAGLTPLEVMDRIVDAAGEEGIMILLDSHRLDDQRIPELWYGDGYSEQDWVDTWVLLAERYRDRPWVIGADLKNEPHGPATWGTGDPATDWRLAAERAGDAILEVAPDWLIVVEGIEGPVEGQQLSGHWWGGNLEAARAHPVRLSQPDQLVYSVHEYGPGVWPQPWFEGPDVAAELARRWAIGFDWLVEEDIAPVIVGEFGGRQVGEDTVEGRWQRQLLEHLTATGTSWIHWSWNPNSTDTGGVLLDDWRTVDQPRLDLLRQAMGEGTGTTSTTTTATAPEATTTTTAPPPGDLEVRLSVSSDWGAGWCADGVVTNHGAVEVTWSVPLEVDGTPQETWNLVLEGGPGTYRASGGAPWNAVVPAGGTVGGWGLCATR